MRAHFVLAGLLAGACSPGPQPPQINLANMDHVAAAVIGNSLAAVRNNLRSGEAWGELGLVLKSAGLNAEARQCFVQAEKLQPTNAHWSYHQGTIDALNRALATSSNSARGFIHLRLGQMLAEGGRWADAEEHFRLAPSPLGLAQVACAQGKWEEAIPHLQQARQSQFTAKAATTLLATTMLRLGQTNEAEMLSREAAALPPDLPVPDPFEARYAFGKRAWIEETQQLLARGEVEPAKVLVSRLLSMYPNAAEGWLYTGRLRLLQNDLARAEQALTRHLQLDPASVDGHLQMGLVYHRQNLLAQAATEFQKALEAKPDSETAHYFLGTVQRAQGDWLAASNSFEAALRHQPTFTPARKALDELARPR